MCSHGRARWRLRLAFPSHKRARPWLMHDGNADAFVRVFPRVVWDALGLLRLVRNLSRPFRLSRKEAIAS